MGHKLEDSVRVSSLLLCTHAPATESMATMATPAIAEVPDTEAEGSTRRKGADAIIADFVAVCCGFLDTPGIHKFVNSPA